MPEFVGVGWREYFDIHFGHINAGMADLKQQVAANQSNQRADHDRLSARLDALEKENDERRGRDRSTEAAIANIKWVLAPVIAATLGLVAKAVVGG